MASDSWAKELLADVAVEAACKFYSEDSSAIFNVLERRLLPLLEAGEAMRDGYDALWAEVHALDTNPNDPMSVIVWDAAKSAALKEATDGER